MTCSPLSNHTPDNTPFNILRGWRATLAAALLAVTALTAFAAPHASAFSDAEELTRFGSFGSGAGELKYFGGVGTDPVTGHLFVNDSANNRISEFSPWGKFVKAFGWDVAPGAVNEQQEVRVRAAEGQFKLSFGASTTTDLAFNAPGSEEEGPGSVEAALNALPTIGGAGGEVSVEAVPAPPDGKTPSIYAIVFKGSLAATNVDELTIANGTTAPSGGIPSSTLEARTRADGTAGGTELESCTAESGCQAGAAGSGAGQIGNNGSGGVAVDSAGNVYLEDFNNLRVQKFDSAGRFILTFGGEVNKTKSAEGGSTAAERNLCTAASTDECGIGVSGNGLGQFASSINVALRGVALCPPGPVCASGALFVADTERIQRFSLDGVYESELSVPGGDVGGLAFDLISEDLYATVYGSGPISVHKLDSTTGAELLGQPLKGEGPVATDVAGNLFVRFDSALLQYDSTGKPLSPPSCCKLPVPGDDALFLSVLGVAVNATGTLYLAYAGSSSGVAFIRALGPPPVAFEAPLKVPPTIEAQFASSVERTGAVLGSKSTPTSGPIPASTCSTAPANAQKAVAPLRSRCRRERCSRRK